MGSANRRERRWSGWWGAASLAMAGCTGSLSEEAASPRTGGWDPGLGDGSAAAADPGRDYEVTRFAREVWMPTVGYNCLSCHVHNGVAAQAGARFSLSDPTRHDYLADNIARLRAVYALQEDGQNLLMGKASGALPHPGLQPLAPQGNAYRAMDAFFADTSQPGGVGAALDDRVLGRLTNLSDRELLTRASVHLSARMPTEAELARQAGGDLDGALDSVLADRAFGTFVMRAFDDVLNNSRSNVNNAGLDQYTFTNMFWPPDKPRNSGTTSAGVFWPHGFQIFWYETDQGAKNDARLRAFDNHDQAQRALTFMGLQLPRYLVNSDGDWRELLTADYLVLNPWSARSLSSDFSYDLFRAIDWADPYDPEEFHPVRLTDRPNWPMSGLMTDAALLQNYPSTATNRQRKRAATFYRLFLGFDPMTLGQRPANLPELITAAANNPAALPPTMGNYGCTSCHAVIDPPARAMMAYCDNHWFSPPDCHPGGGRMFAAGFERVAMPDDAQANPGRWLGEAIANDPRFPRGTVRFFFNLLTGQRPLGDPAKDAPTLSASLAAQAAQDRFFLETEEAFVASGYRVKSVVKRILNSPYYRALDYQPTDDVHERAMLETLVSPHWVGSRRLNAKLLARAGQTLEQEDQWGLWGPSRQTLVRNYEGLLDGDVARPFLQQPRLDPTALMVRATTATASQLACQIVAKNLFGPAAERTLLAAVELQDDGSTPASQARVGQAVDAALARLLGPTADASDRTDALALFSQVVRSGRDAGDRSLPAGCGFPNGAQDTNFTVRAWIATLAFLLADPTMVLE